MTDSPFYLTLNRVKSREYVWRNYERSQSRTATCGLKALGSTVTVTRNMTPKGYTTAGVIGVETCSSMWSCPVCAAKIGIGRRDEVVAGLQKWRSISPHHQVAFMTLTFRHNSTQSLEFLWDSLSIVWRRLQQGRPWQRIRQHYGIRSTIRAVEITHGANGWHVHLHVALLLVDHTNLENLESEIYGRWSYLLSDLGLSALPGIGVDVRRSYDESGLGQYMTKVAQELTGGALKTGKTSRTPFAILAALAERTSEDPHRDRALWTEYMTVSKGRHGVVWGTGLRDYLNIIETTDEQLALLEPQTIELDSIKISSRMWTKLCIYGQLHTLLQLMAEQGPLAAQRYIDQVFEHWAQLNGVT
jgi:hypothetical protein